MIPESRNLLLLEITAFTSRLTLVAITGMAAVLADYRINLEGTRSKIAAGLSLALSIRLRFRNPFVVLRVLSG